MKAEKGKYYYVKFAYDISKWKCVDVVNGIPVFQGEFGLKTREEADIFGEVVNPPFPWLRLLALIGIIALAALSGYAIGRIHGSQSQPVAIEADK